MRDHHPHATLARLLRRGSTLALVLAIAACGRGPDHATQTTRAREIVGPCVTCTPEAYCTDLVKPDERACASAEDCTLVRLSIPSTDCPWGLYGGSFTVLASKAAEPAVLARMKRLDLCTHKDHVSMGSVCRGPAAACVAGRCAYPSGPAEHAF